MIIFLYLIVSLVLLAMLVFGLSLIGHQRYVKRVEEGTALPDETSPFEVTKEVPDECCGQHATCERDSLLAAMSKEIVYYADEELDDFSGRESDEYSDEEAEQFAQVFYELKEIEVAGWVRSLQLRGVNLPDQIKDEVLLIVRERRFRPASTGDHSNDKVSKRQ